MLVLLTKIIPSKVKFKQTKIKQDAFDEIKRIVARNTLIAYPYFNEEFKCIPILVNSKLGAFIRQKGKPITLYSRTLTD